MSSITIMARLALAAILTLFAGTVFAQADACKNRGDLDAQYCDENKDLVADTPKDAKRFKNPNTLVFTYTPVEDPAVYEQAFKPFTEPLAKCTSKKVVFYQVQSNAAEIEAMRSGRLHVGGVSTGPTAFAVNIAGAVPFAVKGNEKEFQGYNLIVIVKKDSPYQKLADLKGKKFAHTAPSSNSGHMAPLALFPPQGLTPDKDYKILFSGKHDSAPVITMERPSPQTCSIAWARAARSRKTITGSFTAARNSPLRRFRTRTTSSRSSATRC